MDDKNKGLAMKLIQLKVTNFRCYENETFLNLDDLVVLVGKNDSGKSSIFDALNIYFEGKSAPDKDDVCVHSEGSTITITCVFSELPEEIILDAQRLTSLAQEKLLNRDGCLEIIKTYNCALAKPRLSKIYARAIHPTADGYHDLLQLTNPKLKQKAHSLNVDLSEVNQSVNTELRHAIWSNSQDLNCQEMDVEIKSETTKEIWEQIKKHLPVFALFKSDRESTDQDGEAQDPLKTAVKEAIKTNADVLDEIANRVKAEVQEIADRTVEKIAEMNPALAKQLTPRVSNKNWDTLFSVNLTGDEDIPINKRGSGTRRLVLLNFFRAKAEKEAKGRSSGVIYAIEEPETSQHPHNQLMLVRSLEDLADRDDCQIFMTTHTPVLARRLNSKSLRLVAEGDKQPIIQQGDDPDTIKAIIKSLGVLPDHNTKLFFGVEGKNDINFFYAISRILCEAGEDIPNLKIAEDLGRLMFVPLGGSNVDLWVSRLNELNRPEFYLFDRDNAPPKSPHYKQQADEINVRDNCDARHTGKRELENYIHKDLIIAEYSNYVGSGDDFEDVPALFAQAVYEESGNDWNAVVSDPEKLKQKISKAKKRLNETFVSRMTPELLTAVDPNNDIREILKQIGTILASD